MKKFRVIYCIEAITDIGELVARRYARNKRTAEKIARQLTAEYVEIRKVGKTEHYWIHPADVEG